MKRSNYFVDFTYLDINQSNLQTVPGHGIYFNSAVGDVLVLSCGSRRPVDNGHVSKSLSYW